MSLIKRNRGFTLVELLIVIVVIAILASITIVAYNNVQQRANNTATISAAENVLKMVALYTAANGQYPLYTASGNIYSCATVVMGCKTTAVSSFSVDAGFLSNMKIFGRLPDAVATTDPTDHYGIVYNYLSSRTMDGNSRPVILLYWLSGINQSCGIAGVADQATAVADLHSSATGYTFGSDGTNKTLCSISVPGPSV